MSGAFIVAGFDGLIYVQKCLRCWRNCGVHVNLWLVLLRSGKLYHQISERCDVMQRAPLLPLLQSPPSPQIFPLRLLLPLNFHSLAFFLKQHIRDNLDRNLKN